MKVQEKKRGSMCKKQIKTGIVLGCMTLVLAGCQKKQQTLEQTSLFAVSGFEGMVIRTTDFPENASIEEKQKILV